MAYVIKHNNPSVGYISWQNLNMQYNGTSYPITDGNTNLIYSWWAINNPTILQSSNDFPTLTAADALVLLNKNGTAILVPGSTVLDGSLVVPGSILADALSANSVTGEKILAGEIDTGHIKAGAITSTTIAADAVGAEAIAAGIIVAEHIHSDAITSDKIVADAITTDKIAANAVTATEIAANSIIAAKIKAGEIDTVHLKAGAITTDKIASTVGGSLDISSNTAITSVVQNISDLDDNKVSTDGLTDLYTSISNSETAIIQLSDNISLLASQTQVDDITSVVSALTTSVDLNTSSINLKASQEDLNALSGIVTNTTAQLEVLTDQVVIDFTRIETDLEGALTELDEVNTYFQFSATDLNIGKSDSPLNITISNEQMSFLDSGSVVAYINGQKMYITQAQILDSLQVGVHIIEKHSNDITFVRWVG